MSLENEKIFSDYYSAYFNKLKVYAYSSLRDWDRAEEAVQDTFHIAWVKIEEFLGSQNPMGWLVNTLKFTIKNIKKADATHTRWFISLEALGDISMSNTFESELDIESACMTILSKEDYYVLKRVILHKATYKELSEELGINLWTCQKRVQRILKKLKKFFDK